MATITSNYGPTIYCKDSGTGEHVVFSHGFPRLLRLLLTATLLLFGILDTPHALCQARGAHTKADVQHWHRHCQ
jgi:hypothetical protein